MPLIRKPFIGILAFIVVLLVMPIGHTLMILIEKLLGGQYQFPGATLVGLLGVILLFTGIKKDSETAGTWFGFFAGILLWTGWVEFAFVFYARHLNISPLMQDGVIVTKSEYLIMPSSIGLLFSTMLYFFFNKQTKCRFFTWFHRNLKMKLPGAISFKNRNFATITALETIYVTWTFYLVLLIAYDEQLFGDRHWFTYLLFAIFLIWSLYLFIRLLKFNKIAPAIRYAIPTVIIFWNSVEILGRWGFFQEIWIKPGQYLLEMILIFVAFIIVTILSILTPKEKFVD